MNYAYTLRCLVAAGMLAALQSGCCSGLHGCGGGLACGGPFAGGHTVPQPPPPLGYTVDPYFKIQESHGEASDFVLHEHEFQRDRVRLNTGGEDHLTQIAVRLHEGAHYPVIVERHRFAVKEGTEFEYPVHEDSELDRQRRDLVVQALTAMGVPDADRRVVVAPRITEGHFDFEAQRVFQQFGFSGYGRGGFGGGLGLGGLGGFGGFGGFGGGFGGFGGGFF